MLVAEAVNRRPALARRGGSVPERLLWVAAALAGEELVLSASLPHPWGHLHRLVEISVVFCGALLFFGWRRLRAMDGVERGVWSPALAAHGAALLTVVVTNFWLLHGAASGSIGSRVAVVLWFAGVVLLPATLLLAAIPPRTLAQFPRTLGSAWAYAGFCALPVVFERAVWSALWSSPGQALARAMQKATLESARAGLSLVYPGVVVDRAQFLLSTRRFAGTIAGLCSGVEGIALMAVTATAWIVWQRRELRLGRALLVAALSLAMMWTLNIVRIVALFAIGTAGYPRVAVGGFHSEAGWIAFTAVAIGFVVACSRWRWLRRTSDAQSGSAGILRASNRTAVYLLPFLAVVAASLLTQAASSGFEWLYPLRLIAALAVLWAYRHAYAKVDWRFGWMGVAAGAAVFLLWIALSGRVSAEASDPMALGLARLTAGQRAAWIAARVAAAVITVPIVEELAFRGFLARRIVAAEFERVEMRDLRWTAVLLSSAAFGLMHGRMWLAGALAGAAFAVVAKVRNRLGEAVAAHATSNLLLAIWVLARGDYRLW